MSIASSFRSLAELAAKKAPYDDALALAQRRAALPVSEGGLGLPAGNTAMERAAAMGYSDAEGYRGLHTAPMSYSGAPLHDLTGGGSVYPDDVYSSMGAQYYGTGDASDTSLFNKFRSLRGKPDASVRVFRAVPSKIMATQGNTIHHGDWVTPSRAYAVQHGESSLSGDYSIQADNVPARALFTNADSPYEFGLDKTQVFADGPASLPAMLGKGFNAKDRSRFAAFDPFRRGESDLLAGIAPYALPAAGAAGLAAMAAPGESEAGIAGTLAKKAPYDDALALAQRRAALPVSQGGLGLPEGNSAMERAAAMGYTTPAWRGTQADELVSRRADYGAMGPGHYSGDSPGAAEGYAGDGSGANIMPLLLRGPFAGNAEMGRAIDASGWGGMEAELAKAGRTGIHDTKFEDAYSTFDPANVRSRFAAFDPRYSGDHGLLKAVAPYAAPAAAVGLAGAAMAPSDSEAGIGGVLAKTADLAALKIAQKADADTSAYAKMMDLKRAANARSRTHGPRASMTPGAEAVRAMAIEAMNPASWPLLWGSRELGDPQARNYDDPYYSYSGSRR